MAEQNVIGLEACHGFLLNVAAKAGSNAIKELQIAHYGKNQYLLDSNGQQTAARHEAEQASAVSGILGVGSKR